MAAAAALACCGVAVALEVETASPPSPAQTAPAPKIAGWDEFVEGLRGLPGRMLAKLPESERNDPQIQQEVGRSMLEALTASSLDALGSDGDHPVFLPQLGQILNVGQPNADTVYRVARITPGGTYRLTGRRGSLRIFKMGQVSPNLGEGGTPTKQVGPTTTYGDFNSLHVDSAGRFDVLLSSNRPAGYSGDWWQLDASANRLLLRMVSSDWKKELDPTIAIQRIDVPVNRPRPTAADLEQRLRRLPAATSAIALLFIDHVEGLRRQGFVNSLKIFDASQLGGLTGQFYYEGAYDLRDDEALIVEAKVPPVCAYRSLILTNELYETTDWYNNQSSLNDSQAKADADGVLRIVVSARDPGVPNWLDTAGYASGLIQGRWTDCDSQPIPTVRKVPLAQVRKSLPPQTPTMTPDERERLIRERRMELQQRPLW
ncbi:MAG: DUF1214 domain-containing protein [Steroidobacteraceae bacterium]